jgi:hypothetical protein
MTAPTFNGCFPHHWRAEILPQRPMILPSRHYIYPGAAEEVEKGALEVLIQPGAPNQSAQPEAQPFLATCALGFRDPAAPTGLWSTPDPNWICAVSGGYAYLVDTTAPERFTMIRYRPVLDVHCYQTSMSSESGSGLLLFVGHHSILAWGSGGEAWESERLSWEGVTIDRIESDRIESSSLYGHGWDLRTDQDVPFVLDLETGKRL